MRCHEGMTRDELESLCKELDDNLATATMAAMDWATRYAQLRYTEPTVRPFSYFCATCKLVYEGETPVLACPVCP